MNLSLSPCVLYSCHAFSQALETAGQVASISVSSAPVAFGTMANQCAAFGTSIKRKLSLVLKLDSKDNTLRLTLPGDEWTSGAPYAEQAHIDSPDLVNSF